MEITCKTILNQSSMGFAEYTLNAYQGCAFSCSYCYVPIMRSRRGRLDDSRWGSWVQVKTNAPEVLRSQMRNVAPNARIAIGTSTDSWQPIEKKYGIARKVLEELTYYPNPIHLLTRSPLLMRDIDVLVRVPSVKVGISLPTFDDKVRKSFEPLAPAVAGRVRLIKSLVDAGIYVMLFWCPILPGVMDHPLTVQEYLRQASTLGVKRVICDTLGYTDELIAQHNELLESYRKQVVAPAPERVMRADLRMEIARWADYYGVNCRL